MDKKQTLQAWKNLGSVKSRTATTSSVFTPKTALKQWKNISPKVTTSKPKVIKKTQKKKIGKDLIISLVKKKSTELFDRAKERAGNLISNLTTKPVSPVVEKPKPKAIKKKSITLKPKQKKLTKQQLKAMGLFQEQKEQPQSAQLTRKTKKYIIEQPKRRDEIIKKEIEKVKRTKLKKGYKEPNVGGQFIESFKQATAGALSGFGGSIEMLGNMAGNIIVSDAGANIRKRWEKVVVSNPEWSEPAEGFSYKDPKKWARLIGGAVPSILGAIATGTVGTLASGGNPVVGVAGTIAYGFGMEGGDTYNEAKEAGVEEMDAERWGIMVGTVNGILESIFPAKFISPKSISKPAIKKITQSLAKDLLLGAKKLGLKVLENGVIEGSTETVQQLISNTVATNYDKNRKLYDGLVDSFLGGFLAGGIIGGVESDVNVNIQPKTEVKEIISEGEKTPQEIIDEVINKGLDNTPEGKELIKSALEAQKTGQNLLIQKQLPILEEQKLLEAPKPSKVGEGFTMTEKADKNKIEISKKLDNYKKALEKFNKKPTPATRQKFQEAKAIIDRLKSNGYIEQVEKPKSKPKSQPKPQPVKTKPIVSTAVTTAVKPKVVKTPSKIAKSIETKAIEQKLTEGFEGLAGYDKITIANQASKANEVLKDIEKTRQIIRGEEALPSGLRGTALITAVEEHIKKTGNTEIAYELANSPLVSDTSTYAQELRLAAEREPDSLAKKLHETKRARIEDFKKRYRDKDVKEVTEKVAKKIKEKVKVPSKYDWNTFINSIPTC